jgi:nucleotide-binding universal stress UspA family protein
VSGFWNGNGETRRSHGFVFIGEWKFPGQEREMNLLYPTDGSEGAGRAGALLARLPLPVDARVTVLTAVPEANRVATLPLEGSITGALYPQFAELAAEAEAAAMETAVAAAAPLRQRGVNAAVSVPQHAPAESILDQAEKVHAELIVMGSHGVGAVERFLIGSVSERVARYAHCSVLVARGDRLGRAIVAVDDSESAEHALVALARLPLPADLEITLVHVLRPDALPPALRLGPGLSGGALYDEYAGQYHALGGQIVEHALAQLRQAGREGATQVRCGAPAEELIAAAQEIDADLIVVGAANKSALGRLFLGSVSGRVLTHAPWSVLVARTAD